MYRFNRNLPKPRNTDQFPVAAVQSLSPSRSKRDASIDGDNGDTRVSCFRIDRELIESWKVSTRPARHGDAARRSIKLASSPMATQRFEYPRKLRRSWIPATFGVAYSHACREISPLEKSAAPEKFRRELRHLDDRIITPAAECASPANPVRPIHISYNGEHPSRYLALSPSLGFYVRASYACVFMQVDYPSRAAVGDCPMDKGARGFSPRKTRVSDCVPLRRVSRRGRYSSVG